MIAIGAGIAAMIVGVVVLLPYLSQGQQQQQQEGQMIIQELAVGLSSVKVSSEDATTATVEVTFSVFNPTRTTVILEHIKYTLYADGTRVGDSMIGESLEGIVAGSGRTNYILPNTQLLLKDTIKVTKTRGLEGVWDTLMAGGVRWEVDGVYSVTGWQEKQFNAAK
ncbi:MAG: hypothetical protein NZ517_01290 [Candidatus Nitrosocaldus sp.]|nr:hypothetical protein [Candidatus Nitrosocaldus sp.]